MSFRLSLRRSFGDKRPDVGHRPGRPLPGNVLKYVCGAPSSATRRLLSAASFNGWRDALTRRQDNVASTKLPDGSEARTLKTVALEAARPDAILEASLVVRTRDWRPVQESLRVQNGSDVPVYELTEISYAVTPLGSLDASIFGVPSPASEARAGAGSPSRARHSGVRKRSSGPVCITPSPRLP